MGEWTDHSVVAGGSLGVCSVGSPARVWRWLTETAYVLCVAAVAAWGFYTDTTATILFAVLLALPAGGPALVGYYIVYGLLAGVSGANPDVASSGGRCTPSGGCESFSTGEPAEWFLHTMDLIGVLAVTAAAVLNVVLLRMLNAMLRNERSRWPTCPSDSAEQNSALEVAAGDVSEEVPRDLTHQWVGMPVHQLPPITAPPEHQRDA